MPTNADYEFEAAKKKYNEAHTNEEKLAALLEMQSTAPRHKGAENLRADITKKISKLRKDMDKQVKKKKSVSTGVRKEGIGQAVIVGMPNTGKSTLLKELTGIDVRIDKYEFTTTEPETGMMDYKGANIQIVELPAIIEGSSKGKANGLVYLTVARNADVLILTYRNSREKEVVLRELEGANIFANEKKPRIVIRETGFKGIGISGKHFLRVKEHEAIQFLHDSGVRNAEIILNESTDLRKLARALNKSAVYLKAFFVNVFLEYDKEKLIEDIFDSLNVVLIYTKKPGRVADYDTPLALPKGTTIEEAAKRVHKELATKLKYARVWGKSKFGGQRVQRDYVLQNFDVVQFQ